MHRFKPTKVYTGPMLFGSGIEGIPGIWASAGSA